MKYRILEDKSEFPFIVQIRLFFLWFNFFDTKGHKIRFKTKEQAERFIETDFHYRNATKSFLPEIEIIHIQGV